MKPIHALLCLIFTALLALSADTVISETRDWDPIPDEFINLGDHLIQEIRRITEIRKDEKYLCLRVTGVYDAMVCDFDTSENPTSFPAVEFVPVVDPSTGYASLNVVIKPVNVNPRALKMIGKPCPIMEEWRIFELDLIFEEPQDGYRETIYFDVKQMGEINRVRLGVSWDNGEWGWVY